MFLIYAFLLNAVLTAAPADRLAVIQAAPDFQLRDQNDSAVRFSQYRGKVVVVSFIFTTCNGACPATTHRVAKVFEECGRRPELKDQVQFLSISLDPERDTPEMLRGYRRLYEIAAGNWTFLTGPPGDVRRVLAAWGMWARPAASGQLDHPSRIYLVDRQGQVREIYNLDFFRHPWALEDIKLLVGEAAR